MIGNLEKIGCKRVYHPCFQQPVKPHHLPLGQDQDCLQEEGLAELDSYGKVKKVKNTTEMHIDSLQATIISMEVPNWRAMLKLGQRQEKLEKTLCAGKGSRRT